VGLDKADVTFTLINGVCAVGDDAFREIGRRSETVGDALWFPQMPRLGLTSTQYTLSEVVEMVAG
jgi:hypothetical protein